MYFARIERVKLSMKNLRPRIHTDGTGFISEDLALICGNNVHRGERTRDENIETNPSIVELESNLLAMQRQESKAQEPPLLIQFRLFNYCCAVKGTLLVNKKVMSKNFLNRECGILIDALVLAVMPLREKFGARAILFWSNILAMRKV